MAEDSEVIACSPVSLYNKRKIDEVDHEPAVTDVPIYENGNITQNPEEDPDLDAEHAVQEADDDPSDKPDAKRPRVVEIGSDAAQEDNSILKSEDVQANEVDDNIPDSEDAAVNEANDDIVNSEDTRADESNASAENAEQPIKDVAQEKEPSLEVSQESASAETNEQSKPKAEISRKIEVPNNKVGVLIGKAGDTIRYLQYNSGAKIQITKDAEADSACTTRPVELIGTPENISKAEQLIKDVIAEAEAGGSPALVARGFAAAQTGGEELLIPIPNDKVGLVIGKGGDTIKSLQTKSGARIQLVPQPEENESKERTIRVTGNKQQLETARDMIKRAMNQAPVKPLAPSGVGQQIYRSGGPSAATHRGSRPPPQSQMGHDYLQRGHYPSLSQYPPRNYGGYPQQHPPPRSSFNAGWERGPASSTQPPHHSGAYGYYGRGGHMTEPPSFTPAPSQVNYSYGHPQGEPGYGHAQTYPRPTPQQGYGQYADSGYVKLNQAQPFYGGQQSSSQPGYPQQGGFQSGHMQDAFNKATYNQMSSQGPTPQSYGPLRAQPGEPQQQQGSAPHGYETSVPSQQPYPYASGALPQQSYPSAPAANDVYNQQPGNFATSPGYGQVGGLAPNSSSYGYQGPTGMGYGNMQGPTYVGPTSNQQGYGLPATNAASYDQQSVPQSGYGSYGGSAPPAYGNTILPQPAYGQYDASQYGR